MIDLDSLLDSPALDEVLGNPTAEALLKEEEPELIEIVELEPGEIDPRLKLLSHSSRTTLHKCPRKYQLYRLAAEEIALADATKVMEQSLTFAYGHAVGEGMASVLERKTEDEVYLEAFLHWDADLLDENTRQKKSFWLALFAIKKFIAMRENGYLDEYDLVYYKGKPAVELSFQIMLPGGFSYRGFVDAVLRHRDSGEIMVLEAKTSSGTANSAMYKNSGQALGYSVVLDILFPKLSSYTVLYLVYETRSYEYKELPFTKSLLQRALWLQELLIDCKRVELYESFGSYPMHGESCFDFFRECEYLGLCTLSTDSFTKKLTTKMIAAIEKDQERYQFVVDFHDLVAAQIAKGEE